MPSNKERRETFGEMAEAMQQRLQAWRRAHPDATFDEIAEQASQERKVMMGNLLSGLVTDMNAVEVDPHCPECEGPLQNKGKKRREIVHREGQVQVERNYYYCPTCKRGFFPPGP